MRSGRGSAVDALIPQIHEIAEALAKDRLALFFAFDDSPRSGNGDRNVRPVAQLAPVLEGKVEQGRQHLAGELDRDLVDPVEGLAARQAIERVAHPLADQALEIGQIFRRDDRLHHLALHVVLRRVHGDEHRQFELAIPVAQDDPPERRTRREPSMVRLEGDDVLVPGHGPVGSERACRAVVDRRLAPQPAEVGLPDVLLVQSGVADVERIERHGFGKRRVIDRLQGAPSGIVRDQSHWLAPPDGRPLGLARRPPVVYATRRTSNPRQTIDLFRLDSRWSRIPARRAA